MKTGDRKIFARTSKYLFDLFEPRERDWILLPRGGRRIVSQRKLAPSLRFTALYGKFEPLVSPSVRKQSAYDVSIGELSMEIPSKLLSNFVQAALPPPLPPPLSPFVSIYAHASQYGAVSMSRCHRSFVRSGLTCHGLNGKGTREKGGEIPSSLWE